MFRGGCRSGRLKSGESLIPELVPDVCKEVATSGLGVEELPVLLGRKVEVAVDVAALESQVQDAVLGVVCRRCEELRFE